MKPISQSQHRIINAANWPGTRQLCSECSEPTGRCEDDQIYGESGPVCEACAPGEPSVDQPILDGAA